MIVRNCPDCGHRMRFIPKTKVGKQDFVIGIVGSGGHYHLCPNCFTAVDFKFRSKWKEVDQNA